MSSTLRPYATAGAVIVGAGLIAITPMAAPVPGITTIRDIMLTAGPGEDAFTIDTSESVANLLGLPNTEFTVTSATPADGVDASQLPATGTVYDVLNLGNGTYNVYVATPGDNGTVTDTLVTPSGNIDLDSLFAGINAAEPLQPGDAFTGLQAGDASIGADAFTIANTTFDPFTGSGASEAEGFTPVHALAGAPPLLNLGLDGRHPLSNKIVKITIPQVEYCIMTHDDIGGRVAASIPAGTTQGQVAAKIGLAAEKFSRSLNGKRAFSAVELAQLAEVLHVDVYWLITGGPDPYRLMVAARHDFDPETGQRDVPGRLRDEPTLNDITLAYKQAFQTWTPEPADLPTSVAEIRSRLGCEFVRPLAERIEARLGVDVIRLPKLSTAYSFTVGPRSVIVIPATGNWFRENWSIAHELGHLAARHHAESLPPAERDRREAAANGFAAELLLPDAQIRSLDWESMPPGELAELVWRLGVSTDALNNRLHWLGLPVSPRVSELLSLSTQKMLRRYWAGKHVDGFDEITERMDAAACRRFPRKIQEAHMELIAGGAIRKHTLAWMLGIDADALEVDEPAPPAPIDTDVLAAALGH